MPRTIISAAAHITEVSHIYAIEDPSNAYFVYLACSQNAILVRFCFSVESYFQTSSLIYSPVTEAFNFQIISIETDSYET